MVFAVGGCGPPLVETLSRLTGSDLQATVLVARADAFRSMKPLFRLFELAHETRIADLWLA